MKFSFKTILSIVTILMIGLILFFSRHQLYQAWQLMAQANIWLLVLVALFTILSYLFSGEMIFSYLRQKKIIKHVNIFTLMRVSLELNFVNHVLPSGGVSGMTYITWRMNKLGISAANAAMGQAVRYVTGFASTIVMLLVSLAIITADGNINRWIILMSAALIMSMVVVTAGLIFIVSSSSRIHKFGDWLQQTTNRMTRVVTRGKKRKILHAEKVVEFFDDMHKDYLVIKREKSLLWQPFAWGLLYVISDILIFYLAFLALGSVVNPAAILIAYSLASLAGFVIITPGGAGAYEAIMVMILAVSGLENSQAIAGVVLARVIVLLITIVAGYVFYQLTLNQYDKRTADIQR